MHITAFIQPSSALLPTPGSKSASNTSNSTPSTCPSASFFPRLYPGLPIRNTYAPLPDAYMQTKGQAPVSVLHRADEGGKNVKVIFLPGNIEVMANPGEPISEVARRAGVEIVESCGVGNCGTCEILLVDDASRSSMYLRSCITVVPSHKDQLILDTVGDSIPPW